MNKIILLKVLSLDTTTTSILFYLIYAPYPQWWIFTREKGWHRWGVNVDDYSMEYWSKLSVGEKSISGMYLRLK